MWCYAGAYHDWYLIFNDTFKLINIDVTPYDLELISPSYEVYEFSSPDKKVKVDFNVKLFVLPNSKKS